jgi:hypothetical protein
MNNFLLQSYLSNKFYVLSYKILIYSCYCFSRNFSYSFYMDFVLGAQFFVTHVQSFVPLKQNFVPLYA